MLDEIFQNLRVGPVVKETMTRFSFLYTSHKVRVFSADLRSLDNISKRNNFCNFFEKNKDLIILFFSESSSTK